MTLTADQKLRRSEIKAAREAAQMQFALGIIDRVVNNPFVWIVGGTLAIEQLEYRRYIGNIIATTAETALFGAAIVKALGPEGTAAAIKATGEVVGGAVGAIGGVAKFL